MKESAMSEDFKSIIDKDWNMIADWCKRHCSDKKLGTETVCYSLRQCDENDNKVYFHVTPKGEHYINTYKITNETGDWGEEKLQKTKADYADMFFVIVHWNEYRSAILEDLNKVYSVIRFNPDSDNCLDSAD